MIIPSDSKSIEINPDRFSGKPVIRNTRFPIDQFIMELAEGRNVGEIAEDFDLDLDTLKSVLEEIAQSYNFYSS
jgi:uncharacterized protein (DUF433 family)